MRCAIVIEGIQGCDIGMGPPPNVNQVASSFQFNLLFCSQVVDMRWGVREEAENDHMSTELCLKELMACKDVSTGPNFVVNTLLFCWNPLHIDILKISSNIGVYILNSI